MNSNKLIVCYFFSFLFFGGCFLNKENRSSEEENSTQNYICKKFSFFDRTSTGLYCGVFEINSEDDLFKIALSDLKRKEEEIIIERIDVSKSNSNEIINQFFKAFDIYCLIAKTECEYCERDLKLVSKPEKYFLNINSAQNFKGKVNDYRFGRAELEVHNLEILSRYNFRDEAIIEFRENKVFISTSEDPNSQIIMDELMFNYYSDVFDSKSTD